MTQPKTASAPIPAGSAHRSPVQRSIMIRADIVRQHPTDSGLFELVIPVVSLSPEYAVMLRELYPTQLERAYRLLDVEALLSRIVDE